VDEHSRIQRLVPLPAATLRMGQRPELFIEDRKGAVECRSVAARGRVEQDGERLAASAGRDPAPGWFGR